MFRIHSGGGIQIPLYYFGRRLKYYPPALTKGTLVLHSNNNNNSGHGDDENDIERLVGFATALLTRMCRKFSIDVSQRLVYDMTPGLNAVVGQNVVRVYPILITTLGLPYDKDHETDEQQIQNIVANTQHINRCRRRANVQRHHVSS